MAGPHNTEKIRAFARSCFHIHQLKQDLCFLQGHHFQVYDGEFKRIFEEEYEGNVCIEFQLSA